MRSCIVCKKELNGEEANRAASRIGVSGMYCDKCIKETFKLEQKSFGDRLRELRKAKGYTQEEMAEKLYLALRTYQNYELMTSYPKLDIAVEIAEMHNVSLDYLVLGKC